MDLEVNIKEEPVLLEGTENFELLSEMIPLKQETKSELTEPGSAQENTFEPSADIKDEIFIEQHALHQLVPYIKEEKNDWMSFIMDASVVTKKESTSVKVEPVSSEDTSGVPEMIPDIGSMKMEDTMPENLMDISFERSNIIIKEEIGNYHTVIEIAHDIKTLKEEGSEDLKIETQDEVCNTLVETLQDEERGVAVYSCDDCSKTFRRKQYLMTHMITHTGERRYNCTICKCSFMQHSHLKNHLLSHSTRRPYKCFTCGSSFKRPYNLRTHYLIHSGNKPFRCSVCGKSFGSLSNVRRHEKSHSDDRPFCCKLCGNSFKSLTDVGRHEKSHTDSRPYHCSLCGISFKRSSHLRRHEKRLH